MSTDEATAARLRELGLEPDALTRLVANRVREAPKGKSALEQTSAEYEANLARIKAGRSPV
jgi:hypothetical protein